MQFTQKETIEIVINELMENRDITKKEMKRLFNRALISNLVIEELNNMIDYLIENNTLEKEEIEYNKRLEQALNKEGEKNDICKHEV